MSTTTSRLALITGGSGYFGSLLRDRLVAARQPVRIFDLVDADDRTAGVEFVRGDICDPSAVEQACRGVDTIYHCVAQVPLAKNRRLFRAVNEGGTEIMLRAARNAGVRKVIYVSSSAVFGVPKSNPVTEETTPSPGEAYGRAKLAGETLCHRAVQEGIDVSIVRPRTIMGHGRLGIFHILFDWIHDGYNVPVLGGGGNVYQFVHADDLAQACILAATRPGASIYNCGAERFGTMREVLEALCRNAATGSRVRSVPMAPAVLGMKITSAIGLSPLGPYHALMYGRSMYFDITKAQTELGWQPRYSNEEMFIESYEWFVANRVALQAQRNASHHRSPVSQRVLGVVKHLL